MIVYDKNEIKSQLSLENVYGLLEDWGGEPQYIPTGLISRSICHNQRGEGKYKLYYYTNTQLFQCYSNCGFFDIFQLCINVMNLQHNIVYDLNDAVRWIAQHFGFSGREEEAPKGTELDDWKILANYSRIQDIKINIPNIILKEYDDTILSRFNYDVKLTPWLNEGISQQVLDHAEIGYYPGGAQITIPHFDKAGRFIGLRGRSLVEDEAALYGKYRPIKVGNQIYSHPLGLNLYNFNNSCCVIPKMRKAIVFEGEVFAPVYFSQLLLGVCGEGKIPVNFSLSTS